MTTPLTRRFAFVADLEDRPGALNRVVSQFRHRGYELDSLTLCPGREPGVSRLTFTIRATAAVARRVGANLGRLLEVLHIEDGAIGSPVLRELALVKLAATAEHAAVARIVAAASARQVDAGPGGQIVELAGSPAQIDAFVAALRPFGVTEVIRSGAVMMAAGLAEEPARDDAPRVPLHATGAPA
jgi:acetolactate synthase-1/3 small subunit